MVGEAVGYASGNDERIRTLIASAKQSQQNGRPQDAERLHRQAEMEAPRHPLVLNNVALRMIASGNPAGAVALLEDVVASEPSNPDVWFNFAGALRRVGRLDDAIAALDRQLALDPRSLSALLEKGSLEEMQGKTRAAAMTYRNALQMIPKGFRTPAWMDVPLQRAREVVDANNRALETYVEEGLRDIRALYPDAPLDRFDQCVDIILQKRGIFRQQPTFIYFPEMPSIEFYRRDLFPWLDSIEAAADDIRAELVEVLCDGAAALDPYVADPRGMPMDQWRELNNSRRWGVYSLWREGKEFPEHIARCPRTVAALQAWPRWDVPGSGPTAMFSILDARTRIPAHTGPVNTRLVVHLPLIVPPGCGFRVGGRQREWVPGEAFVFDDSINHEAWNDGDLPRAVMIFDTWSPFLSGAERALTRALTVRIGEYYGTLANSRGI